MIYNQVEKLNCRNNCLFVGEGEIIFLFMAFQYSIYITMQIKKFLGFLFVSTLFYMYECFAHMCVRAQPVALVPIEVR